MLNKKDEKVIEQELYDRELREVTQIKDLSTSNNIQDYPDAKKHQLISFIKSGIRIIGYIFIPFNLVISAILLILSEIVGIIEELV